MTGRQVLYFTNRNVVNTSAFSTYNFQRIRAILAYVFQVFGWETSNVFYVVVFAAWAVEDYVTFYGNDWIKLAEEA